MAAGVKSTHVAQSESAATLSAFVESSQGSAFHSAYNKSRIAPVVTLGASIFLIVLGFAVLVGWWLGIVWLKSLTSGLVTMKPNTAVCFLLSGISLFFLRSEDVSGVSRRLAQLAGAIVTLIGSGTLVEYLFTINLHIDQWLFPAAVAAEGSYAGRMAFATALNFFLLGGALLFLDKKPGAGGLTDLLAGCAGAVTLLAFLAYIYDVEALYRVFPFASVALHTVFGFLVLCIGILFARVPLGFVAVFLSDTSGGIVARRLLPVAIVLPPLIGWLRLLGERRGFYDTAFGIAMVASVLVIFLVVIIGHTARTLDSAEIVRRRADDRTRRVVEAATSAMIIIDSRGRIVLVNSQAEKLFDYDRRELLNQSIEMLVPDRYRSLHPHHRDEFFLKPTTRAMGAGRDLFGRRKDGGEVPIEIGLNPIYTDEGTFILADIIDITKRKATEDVLRKSEERAQRGKKIWEKTFDAIREGILVHDQDMKIVRCNAEAAQMLSLTPAQAIGFSFNEAFAHLFGKQAADYYLDRDRQTSSSFEAITPKGQKHIVSIFPMKESDGDPFTVVTWNDVTQLSQILDQLARSQRLASVGQLAAGVAHEVNNPLAAITTCAEAIMRDLKRNGDKNHDQVTQWNFYLEEIVRQSLRCKEITRGLLDLTRQRSAKLVLCDINALVKHCTRLAVQRAAAHINFEINLEADMQQVATDEEMVRQVLDNLLTNAIDALAEQPGRITVLTKRDGDRILVEINDTGAGIPSELLAQIFDPFFSTKGPGKGYGLGLAISQTLAETLGGRITVQSKVGEGSSFRLWIPRRAPEQAAP